MAGLVILKAGAKIASLADYPGDYEDWIAAGMGVPRDSVEVRSIYQGEALPALEETAAVIITGSDAMVTERAPWMLEGEAWLRQAVAARVPILGICFGHQLLARALGGEVGDNPRGTEVGSVTVRRVASDDSLFAGLPESFPAQATHRQSVLQLPPGARLLASSDLDPHQAFALGEKVWGVQFHPEFNDTVVRHYVEAQRARLAGEANDPDGIVVRCVPTPESCGLLGRFAELAGVRKA